MPDHPRFIFHKMQSQTLLPLLSLHVSQNKGQSDRSTTLNRRLMGNHTTKQQGWKGRPRSAGRASHQSPGLPAASAYLCAPFYLSNCSFWSPFLQPRMTPILSSHPAVHSTSGPIPMPPRSRFPALPQPRQPISPCLCPVPDLPSAPLPKPPEHPQALTSPCPISLHPRAPCGPHIRPFSTPYPSPKAFPTSPAPITPAQRPVSPRSPAQGLHHSSPSPRLTPRQASPHPTPPPPHSSAGPLPRSRLTRRPPRRSPPLRPRAPPASLPGCPPRPPTRPRRCLNPGPSPAPASRRPAGPPPRPGPAPPPRPAGPPRRRSHAGGSEGEGGAAGPGRAAAGPGPRGRLPPTRYMLAAMPGTGPGAGRGPLPPPPPGAGSAGKWRLERPGGGGERGN